MCRRYVQNCTTLQLGEEINDVAGKIYPRHARAHPGIFRQAFPGVTALIRSGSQANKANRTSRYSFLGFRQSGRIIGPLVVRKTVGCAAEGSDDLAFDIDSVVVGIIHVRRMDAETDENHLRGDIGLRADRIATHNEVLFPALYFFDVILVEHELRGIDVDPSGHHRYLLVPAVVTAGLEANFRKKTGDIGRRLVVARRTGHAAHARIVGKEFKVRLDAIAIDQCEALIQGIQFGSSVWFGASMFRRFSGAGGKHSYEQQKDGQSILTIHVVTTRHQRRG